MLADEAASPHRRMRAQAGRTDDPSRSALPRHRLRDSGHRRRRMAPLADFEPACLLQRAGAEPRRRGNMSSAPCRDRLPRPPSSAAGRAIRPRPSSASAIARLGIALGTGFAVLGVAARGFLEGAGSAASGSPLEPEPIGSSASSRSSSGLRSSSVSTKAASSRLESCSSLIACCSCGVITRLWLCRSSSFGVNAILETTGSWPPAARH